MDFAHSTCQVRSAKWNTQLVTEGRLLGLMHPVQLRGSYLGVIPKLSQLIVDLSLLIRYSVNDGVDPDLCSLEYASVAQATNTILGLGHLNLIAKQDLASVYQNIRTKVLPRKPKPPRNEMGRCCCSHAYGPLAGEHPINTCTTLIIKRSVTLLLN